MAHAHLTRAEHIDVYVGVVLFLCYFFSSPQTSTVAERPPRPRPRPRPTLTHAHAYPRPPLPPSCSLNTLTLTPPHPIPFSYSLLPFSTLILYSTLRSTRSNPLPPTRSTPTHFATLTLHTTRCSTHSFHSHSFRYTSAPHHSILHTLVPLPLISLRLRSAPLVPLTLLAYARIVRSTRLGSHGSRLR